jgi:hypothetical protein
MRALPFWAELPLAKMPLLGAILGLHNRYLKEQSLLRSKYTLLYTKKGLTESEAFFVTSTVLFTDT